MRYVTLKNQLKKLTEGKKVLILGFGREGRSTYSLLNSLNCCSELAISDKNNVTVEDKNVKVIYGDTYLDVLDDYDIVFKSPGIVLPKDFSEYKCCITSQTEQFLKVYSKQTVGITGTKGKSTTSSLLYHILSNNECDSILCGNIGIPVFDMIDIITENTVIVFEMSCHQLEYIGVSPSIAVFLNLYEDHLDHYGSFEKYASAKKNIYRYQLSSDILFCNPDFMPDEGSCKADIIKIDPSSLSEKAKDVTKLRGTHNHFNITVVYEISKRCGVSDEGFISALATFSPLSHRLEFIGNFDGIDFYDDSISTTAESAISAVNSIANAETLLIGGMDRGIDYTKLIEFLLVCDLDTVILMYESGKRILESLENAESSGCKFVYCPDLQSAVECAKERTAKNKACILSPAAASYGYFKNFEERGDVFASLVKNTK